MPRRSVRIVNYNLLEVFSHDYEILLSINGMRVLPTALINLPFASDKYIAVLELS